MITKKTENCLRQACDEFKKEVSRIGCDGTSGLLDKWSAEDYYKKVMDKIDEFTKTILEHPFFVDKNYKTLADVYESEKSLFLYCLQCFLNDEFLGVLPCSVETVDVSSIEVNPDTMEAINKENKKEFVKEVFDGVPQKTSLKEFLQDPRSYKQFRDQVDECMFYMDWGKIHRIMKMLKWGWARWIDEEYNEHENTVPSVYGIKRHVYDMIKRMENWIFEHDDADYYFGSTGGFEYEMKVCEGDVDDFDGRVKLAIRFVAEEFDTGM